MSRGVIDTKVVRGASWGIWLSNVKIVIYFYLAKTVPHS